MICSICQGEIEQKGYWRDGHNAVPVNTGRCCDRCNDCVVLPARIANLNGGRDPYAMAEDAS